MVQLLLKQRIHYMSLWYTLPLLRNNNSWLISLDLFIYFIVLLTYEQTRWIQWSLSGAHAQILYQCCVWNFSHEVTWHELCLCTFLISFQKILFVTILTNVNLNQLSHFPRNSIKICLQRFYKYFKHSLRNYVINQIPIGKKKKKNNLKVNKSPLTVIYSQWQRKYYSSWEQVAIAFALNWSIEEGEVHTHWRMHLKNYTMKASRQLPICHQLSCTMKDQLLHSFISSKCFC